MLALTIQYFLNPQGQQLFEPWLERVKACMVTQPGFVDCALHWQVDMPVVTLNFASQDELDAWASCPEHDAFFDEIAAYFERDVSVQVCECFTEMPEDFAIQLDTALCFVAVGDKLLALRKYEAAAEGGHWGAAGGKLEAGEEPIDGALRELREETGICLSHKDLHFLARVFIRKPQASFSCHLFYTELDSEPEITLSREHTEYIWACPETLRTLPLMIGSLQLLQYVKRLIA